jgi:hypothetical protein
MNPPISLLVFQQISWVDPNALAIIWYVLSIVMLGIALFILFRVYQRTATVPILTWIFALGGVWDTLYQGQIYPPLLLAQAGAIAIMNRHPVIAGLFTGFIVAVKPNFALWPLAMFLIGRRAFGLSAFFSAIALSVLPALVYGPGVYLSWLHGANNIGLISYPSNASLWRVAFGHNQPALLFVFFLLIILLLVIWVYRSHPDERRLGEATTIVCILLSPIAWPAYAIFALPSFINGRFDWKRITAALLLLNPADTPWMSINGLICTLALLILLWSVITEPVAITSESIPTSKNLAYQ